MLKIGYTQTLFAIITEYFSANSIFNGRNEHFFVIYFLFHLKKGSHHPLANEHRKMRLSTNFGN